MTAALFALALLPNAPDLRVGDRWTAELAVRYVNAAEELDQTMTDRLDVTVQEVTTAVLTLAVRRRLESTRFGEDTVPGPKGSPQEYTVTVPLLTAEPPRDTRRAESGERRIDRWVPLVLPATRGASAQAGGFTQMLAAVPDRGLPAVRVRYERAAASGRSSNPGTRFGGQSSWSVDLREGSGGNLSGAGTATVQTESTVVLSWSAKVPKVPIPGGSSTADAEVSLRVLDLVRRR